MEVCKKAKKLLIEKKKIEKSNKDKEEQNYVNEKELSEYFKKGICPWCGSTKIKKIYLGKDREPMHYFQEVINYKHKCIECGCTGPEIFIDNCRFNPRNFDYSHRKKPKKYPNFFQCLFIPNWKLEEIDWGDYVKRKVWGYTRKDILESRE